LLKEGLALARSLEVTPAAAARSGLALKQDGVRRSALDLLAMPEVGITDLCRLWPELARLPGFVVESLEAEALYAGYTKRQAEEIEVLRKEQELLLPAELDYREVPSLSAELRQKLSGVRPVNLAQASRIDGMTPAALSALLGYVRRQAPRGDA
jgi:tRNA uridine 5-carboxymethylaminomethyl modification enzyme